MTKKIQIGKFKAECLHLMAEVNRTGRPLTVTKHNIPLVTINPVETPKKKPIFGCMKGTLTIQGDIISPIRDQWDADRD